MQSDILSGEDCIFNSAMDSPRAQNLKYDSSCPDFPDHCSVMNQHHDTIMTDISETAVSNSTGKQNEASNSESTVLNNENNEISNSVIEVHKNAKANFAQNSNVTFSLPETENILHSNSTNPDQTTIDYEPDCSNFNKKIEKKFDEIDQEETDQEVTDIKCLKSEMDDFDTSYIEESRNVISDILNKVECIFNSTVESPRAQNLEYDSACPDFLDQMGLENQHHNINLADVSETTVSNCTLQENETPSSELTALNNEKNEVLEDVMEVHENTEGNCAHKSNAVFSPQETENILHFCSTYPNQAAIDYEPVCSNFNKKCEQNIDVINKKETDHEISDIKYLETEKDNFSINYIKKSENVLPTTFSKEDFLFNSTTNSRREPNLKHDSTCPDFLDHMGLKNQHHNTNIADVSETTVSNCTHQENETPSSESTILNNENNEVSNSPIEVHENTKENFAQNPNTIMSSQSTENILHSRSMNQDQAAIDYEPVCSNFNKNFEKNINEIDREETDQEISDIKYLQTEKDDFDSSYIEESRNVISDILNKVECIFNCTVDSHRAQNLEYDSACPDFLDRIGLKNQHHNTNIADASETTVSNCMYKENETPSSELTVLNNEKKEVLADVIEVHENTDGNCAHNSNAVFSPQETENILRFCSTYPNQAAIDYEPVCSNFNKKCEQNFDVISKKETDHEISDIKYLETEKDNFSTSCNKKSENVLPATFSKEDCLFNSTTNSRREPNLKHDSTCPDFLDHMGLKNQHHNTNISDASETTVSNCMDTENETPSSELTVLNHEKNEVFADVIKVHENTEGNCAHNSNAVFSPQETENILHFCSTYPNLAAIDYEPVYSNFNEKCEQNIVVINKKETDHEISDIKYLQTEKDNFSTSYIRKSENVLPATFSKEDCLFNSTMSSRRKPNLKYDSTCPDFSDHFIVMNQLHDSIITDASETTVLNCTDKENETSSSESIVLNNETIEVSRGAIEVHENTKENFAQNPDTIISSQNTENILYSSSMDQDQAVIDYEPGCSNFNKKILQNADEIGQEETGFLHSENVFPEYLKVTSFFNQAFDVSSFEDVFNKKHCKRDKTKSLEFREMLNSESTIKNTTVGTHAIFGDSTMIGEKADSKQILSFFDGSNDIHLNEEIVSFKSPHLEKNTIEAFTGTVSTYGEKGNETYQFVENVSINDNCEIDKILTTVHENTERNFTEIYDDIFSQQDKEKLSHCSSSNEDLIDTVNDLTCSTSNNAFEVNFDDRLQKNASLLDSENIFPVVCSNGSTFIYDIFNEEYNKKNEIESLESRDQFEILVEAGARNKATSSNYTENKKDGDLENLFKYFNESCDTLIDYLDSADVTASESCKEIDYLDFPQISANEAGKEVKQTSLSTITACSVEENKKTFKSPSDDIALITDELCSSVYTEDKILLNNGCLLGESNDCLDLALKSTASTDFKENISENKYPIFQIFDTDGVSVSTPNQAENEDLSTIAFESNSGGNINSKLGNVTETGEKNVSTNQTNFDYKLQQVPVDISYPNNIISNVDFSLPVGVTREKHTSSIASNQSKDVTDETVKEFQIKSATTISAPKINLGISTEVKKCWKRNSKGQFAKLEPSPKSMKMSLSQDTESNIQNISNISIDTSIKYSVEDFAIQQPKSNVDSSLDELFRGKDNDFSQHHSSVESKNDFNPLQKDGSEYCLIYSTESVTDNIEHTTAEQIGDLSSALHLSKEGNSSPKNVTYPSYSGGLCLIYSPESMKDNMEQENVEETGGLSNTLHLTEGEGNSSTENVIQSSYSGSNDLNILPFQNPFANESNLNIDDPENSANIERSTSSQVENMMQYEATVVKKQYTVERESKHYVCPCCSEIFKFKSLALRHQLTHTDQKLHICLLCNKSYCRAETLKYHLLKFHNIKRNSMKYLKQFMGYENSAYQPIKVVNDLGGPSNC